jgi:pimeloyl-ACP methyl ester carboxylesterase
MDPSATLSRAARRTKSTGVRIGALHATLMRGYFGALARVAPRSAERQAALLFCFPRRLPHHDVPPVPREAREQLVSSGAKRLMSWTWGEGPRVLLAHGWEGTGRDMVPIANALAQRGRSVTVFDMPAHGRSTGRTTTLIEMANAVAAVARATGTPDAVVGHSLGAAAAVLALRDGLAASSAALLAPVAEPWLFLRRLADLLSFSEARYEGLIAQIERRAGIAIHQIDGATAARSLVARVLILHDPADRQVPYSQSEALAGAWKGATLHPVRGLGHRRLLYDPEAVQRVVGHVIE